MVVVGPLGSGKASALVLAACGAERVLWVSESERVGAWARAMVNELSPGVAFDVVAPLELAERWRAGALVCAPDVHLWSDPDGAWAGLSPAAKVIASTEADGRARGWAEALAGERCGFADVSAGHGGALATTRFRVIAPWRDAATPDAGYEARLAAELSRTVRQGHATRILGRSREALGAWATRLMQDETGPERARLGEEHGGWCSLGLEHDAPEAVDPAPGVEREVVAFGVPDNVTQWVREALATDGVEKGSCRAAIVVDDATSLLRAAVLSRHAQLGRIEATPQGAPEAVEREVERWSDEIRAGRRRGQSPEHLAYALVERLRVTRGQAHAVLASVS